MKDVFAKETKTLIEETIDRAVAEHKPYAVLNIGTTGTEEDDVATRFYGAIFSYNKKTKIYEQTAVFDRLLAPPPELIPILQDPDSVKGDSIRYQLIRNHVDPADYINGMATLSPKEMQREFAFFLKAVGKCGFTLINNFSWVKKYLDKINAADKLQEYRNNMTLFDQGSLTQVVYPLAPKMSKGPGPASLQDVALYAFKIKDLRTAEQKISVLSDIVREYTAKGRGQIILQDAEADKVLAKEALSEQGLQKYHESELEDKFDYLLGNTKSNNAVLITTDPYIKGQPLPKILTPNTDRLKKVINHKKGFSVIAVSTTGLKSSGNVTNQPLHMTMIPYQIRDGRCFGDRSNGFDVYIACNEAEVMAAKANADAGKYDVFLHGKIDYNKYMEDSNAGTLANAEMIAKKIASYLSQYPISDYPLIGCGGDKYENKLVLFPQGALLNMDGVSPEDKAAAQKIYETIPEFCSRGEAVDFTGAIAEIAYNKWAGFEDYGDRFMDLANWEEEGFRLDDLGHHKFPAIDMSGSLTKCTFMGRMVEAYMMDLRTYEMNGGKVVKAPAPAQAEAQEDTKPQSKREEVSPKAEEKPAVSAPAPAPNGLRRLRRVGTTPAPAPVAPARPVQAPVKPVEAAAPVQAPMAEVKKAPVAAAPAPTPVQPASEDATKALLAVLANLNDSLGKMVGQMEVLNARVEKLEEAQAKKTTRKKTEPNDPNDPK